MTIKGISRNTYGIFLNFWLFYLTDNLRISLLRFLAHANVGQPVFRYCMQYHCQKNFIILLWFFHYTRLTMFHFLRQENGVKKHFQISRNSFTEYLSLVFTLWSRPILLSLNILTKGFSSSVLYILKDLLLVKFLKAHWLSFISI